MCYTDLVCYEIKKEMCLPFPVLKSTFNMATWFIILALLIQYYFHWLLTVTLEYCILWFYFIRNSLDHLQLESSVIEQKMRKANCRYDLRRIFRQFLNYAPGHSRVGLSEISPYQTVLIEFEARGMEKTIWVE